MNTRRWILYLQTLSMLIHSGIDLLTAHQLMAKQTRFLHVQSCLWQVCHALSEGQGYHRSLRALHPPPLLSIYLQFGEQTGQLEHTVLGLCHWLRRHQQFKQQCTQALIYPSVILCTSLLLIMGMIFWVLPQFIVLYHQLNAELPPYLTWIVNTITPLHCLSAVLIMSLLCIGSGIAWRSRGYLRILIEKSLFAAPMLGPIFSVSSLSQQCELLALACRSGIPLPDALAILWQYGQYAGERQAWGSIHTCILQGMSLSQAMKQTQYFDSTFIELIHIGEQAGRLDEQFEQTSIYYTETLLEAMYRFKEAIQPSMMLILGVILGGWVILLYYPIIQLGYLVG